LSDRSVDSRTRAGDPFAHAAGRRQLRRERRTEAELVEAIREDEEKLGRRMTHGERVGFARGFFGPEYVAEVRLLSAEGLLDEEDGEEE
jgi:hypothetical protein